MSHITGTLQSVSPAIMIGPDSDAMLPSAPNTWTLNFSPAPPPDSNLVPPESGGTKFVILHFTNANLPANNRLEVDLGYDTDGTGMDIFTSANGPDFWTRPINVYVMPGGQVTIRYITNGAANGNVVFDKYGRGEWHEEAPVTDPLNAPLYDAFSNCDPFIKGMKYEEPMYAHFWVCGGIVAPNWENITCETNVADIRRVVARSVGMMLSVEGDKEVSTCSVTLIAPDLVITAGHCWINPAVDWQSTSVTFDYQVDCNGTKPKDYHGRFHKVIELVAQRFEYSYPFLWDYCVMRLKVPPGGLGIPPIQLRHDLPAVGEKVFCIHHPNGAVKKLSIPHPDFATVTSSDAELVKVNLDVAGGSSGSGLFDIAGRFIGVLSRGEACDLRYFPAATIIPDFTTPTAAPPMTRDVMLVFDRSGSMSLAGASGRPKIDEARDATSLFVQLVRAGTGNRVGLVSFSTTASSPVDHVLSDVNKLELIGPPPFTGRKIGDLVSYGSTTIGGGLEAARLQFPVPGTNPRTVLLLTDGLQNTPPMVTPEVDPIPDIQLHAIGYGTEASLDGALLTDLATTHDGTYIRADTNLQLEKFFAQAFGNIFESGLLADPEFFLPEGQLVAKPFPFNICGEETITIVVGWDRVDATLLAQVKTPLGVAISGGSPGVEQSVGRTWMFLRIPLPQGSERDGMWNVEVFRPTSTAEIQPPVYDVHYFVNVIASGGPRFERIPTMNKFYTGDTINPLVALMYRGGGITPNAKVKVTVARPDASIGNILTKSGLSDPVTLEADTIPARQATLQAMEQESGRPIVNYKENFFELFDDPANSGGQFKSGRIFGNQLKDLLTVEGNYTFHFHATYGEECTATREFLWSIHVDTAVDPSRSEISTTDIGSLPDGSHEVIIVFIPRDKYGNNLGPGRADGLTIAGSEGTTVTGPVKDNGDGSYSIPGVWNPASGQTPGIVIGQPGRPPVVIQEPKPEPKEDFRKKNVLTDLIALRSAVTDKQVGQKLEEAIKHLSNSLNPSLWVDGNTLEAKHGEMVFSEEKDAVIFISDLIKTNDGGLAGALQEFVSRLIAVDHALAEIALHQAISAGGAANLIAQAQNELAQGDSKASSGKYTVAIGYFRNVWKHAQQAMKK